MQRDVAHFHLVFVHALALHAVVYHHIAKRAGSGDAIGPGGQQLLRAFHIHLLADMLFHPHPSTASPAAHALGAVALCLHHFNAADRPHHIPRCQIHIVVPTQIARIVIHQPTVQLRLRHIQPPLLHQLGKQLAVVDHFVVSA